jgi:hypothetical protein
LTNKPTTNSGTRRHHHNAAHNEIQRRRFSAKDADKVRPTRCSPCALLMNCCRVPLNDDRQEKANRRHALQEAQRNSLRASATPARSRISLAAGQNSPHTPSQDQDDMPTVAGTAVTPMKRVMPLLANFEEWMKMATDNVCT